MIKIAKVDCHGCHACKNICPVDAISMISDSEGFWYPEVNDEACIKCGLCIKSCSSLNPVVVKTNRKGYAAYNKDLDTRLKSSSGGIFTLLAEQIIQQNGVVFGAAFDENNIVKHIGVNNIQELNKLQGSKYVQSEIGTTYMECREYLKSNVPVLFSGTPCQITGLKSYLVKDYKNLLTIDIICHGVPSPKVWEIYKESLANKKQLSKISFREKTPSWENYSISYTIDGVKKNVLSKESMYMRAFLSDLCLRPSCYQCKSKKLDRHSDITIGDFWGINNIIPTMNDQKGTSFIISHNDKGEFYMKSLYSNIVCEEVTVEDAILYNPSAITSVSRHPRREAFLQGVNVFNFNELTTKCLRLTLTERCKLLVKRISMSIIRRFGVKS